MPDPTVELRPFCTTIVIVGAMRLPMGNDDQLHEFMARVQQALYDVFPDFVPGQPRVTFNMSELHPDWPKYSSDSTK